MSIDYGDARTGLAVCDRTELIASPAGLIDRPGFKKSPPRRRRRRKRSARN